MSDKICKCCIVPDSYPRAELEDGICAYCRNNAIFTGKLKNVLGKEKLLEALSSTEKRSDYDCIVPLSGGKDSSFVLYYVVRELGLKPLAVFFDSGFTTAPALDNVKTICTVLGVDLVVGTASRFRRNIIQESLRASVLKGRFLICCHNCENNLRSCVIREANSRGIPFVLWGSTDFEDKKPAVFLDEGFDTYRNRKKSTFFEIFFGFLKSAHFFKDFSLAHIRYCFHNYFMKYYYVVRDNMESCTSEGIIGRFNPLLKVSWNQKGIKVIYFFDYINYDPIRNIDILKREVGWRGSEGKEMRLDCRLDAVANLTWLNETGLTADGFIMSTLVRNNLLSRDEALKKEAAIREHLKDDVELLYNEFDIDAKKLIDKNFSLKRKLY